LLEDAGSIGVKSNNNDVLERIKMIK